MRSIVRTFYDSMNDVTIRCEVILPDLPLLP